MVPAELIKPPVLRMVVVWTLDIASNASQEDDRVTDLCGTARLGGQVCPQEVWLHVQTVSCNDRRLDLAQDQDLSERKRLCSTHGPVSALKSM